MANASGQARVYRSQGATEMVVASGGRILLEPGSTLQASGSILFGAGSSFQASGQITFGAGSSFAMNGTMDASAGAIILPGVLREGVIDLPLWAAAEVSSADSLNEMTSGTNPAIGRINAGTDPKGRVRWTSGAGGNDPIQWDLHVPTDLSTAFPLRVQLYGEVASGAVNGWNVDVRFGVGDANAGATVALTSTPTNATVAVASGDILANTPLSVVVNPVSSTGTVDLFGARVVYTKRSS